MSRYEQLTVNELTLEAPLKSQAYTVATVPLASRWTGSSIYVSNGAAGSPIMAFSNGTDWLRCDTGAAIAAA